MRPEEKAEAAPEKDSGDAVENGKESSGEAEKKIDNAESGVTAEITEEAGSGGSETKEPAGEESVGGKTDDSEDSNEDGESESSKSRESTGVSWARFRRICPHICS